METRTGNTLRVIGDVVCIVGVIINVILAICCYSAASSTLKSLLEFIYSVAGTVFLIGGTLSSLIFGAIVYGIGEVVGNVQDVKQQLEVIKGGKKTEPKPEELPEI